ncbi:MULTISPECIES: fimbrial protein [unclassified Enterobacter]|jgi:type 1 fimbria pilin|uniref:fimbrial protein n=1 Tax=unclassified Enterobacter TaxID=2608935 RepID=UPI0015CA9298|nr:MULTISPECIES: fimbrial protein [unclassified Enterobacter]MBB3303873.1 type 1 fimbria pilin [Enterobacter sp. Sphag1F]NYI13022.1 type 1 fimbria pilin [Enterobacter sp. Sphag71]
MARAAPNLLLKGTIIEPPPCKINDDQPIDISFGEDLGVSKINGDNYRQKINYVIKCATNDSSFKLMLTVSGNIMSKDNTAIRTSKSGLGIRILQNNQRVRIGSTWIIDMTSPPVLEAVPVADPAIKLSEGSFLATASLVAEYQ